MTSQPGCILGESLDVKAAEHRHTSGRRHRNREWPVSLAGVVQPPAWVPESTDLVEGLTYACA